MTSCWEGINDASSDPARVWLTRWRDDDPWKPLRKCDCCALNKSKSEGSGQGIIEGGRATADFETNTIEYNFYNLPNNTQRQLTSAIWFQKEHIGKNKFQLTPILSLPDEFIMEGLYNTALTAASSSVYNDDDLNALLLEVTPLKDEQTHNVYIAKTGGSLSVRKCLRRNFMSLLSLEGSMELHRGYSEYSIDGEEEEVALGPVNHVIFLIHGVGEAVWSRENVNIPDFAEDVHYARTSVNKKMYTGWKQECDKATREGQELPSPPNRIEFIPIQWSDQIHSTSSTVKNTLISTTLPSIPKLRVVANDVVFDVLMYQTPEFCENVLTTVTERICHVYDKFQSIHDGFITQGGTCSLVGHSLGSVIAWDILSILQDNMDANTLEATTSIQDSSLLRLSSFDGYQAFANDDAEGGGKTGTWGPSLTKKMSMVIPFTPKFTFLLGSPLGMFLTLRGALPVFDNMRLKSSPTSNEIETIGGEEVSPSSPFSLPGSVYNIFHGSDPVAYRIEPLLLPPETDQGDIPPPPFLVPEKRGMRFHVKAKEIGDNVFNAFSGIIQNSIEKIPDSSAQNMLSKRLLVPKKNKKYLVHNFALGGESTRVDFQLQGAVVENEYLSAVSAHTSYFYNDDLLEYIIQCAHTT